MNKKTILITGSNGLLGQKLTDLLLQTQDFDFIASGKGSNRHPKKDIHYIQLDITNQNMVNEVMDTHQPNFLINTAAMTNVDACEDDKELCDQLNVNAVKYLAMACERNQTRMVHLSTDFIFDGTEGPYAEDASPAPLSYYGESKLKGELLVKEHCSDWSILRTVLVYGIVNDMSRSNIVLWAKEALMNQKEINVVDDQFRTPTLAEDLAQGCYLACKHEAQGIYNISGKDFMSIYELVERVAKYYDLPMSKVGRTDSKSLNQKAMRPPVTGFILDKAITDLGYQPRTFEEGIDLLESQLRQFDRKTEQE